MMLLDLAEAARRSGLTVVEEPGWRTRGHGSMTAVQSIICNCGSSRWTSSQCAALT